MNRRLAGNVATYVVLVLGAAITLGPYLLSLSTALKTPRQFSGDNPLSFPDPLTLTNFGALFGGQHEFTRYFLITAEVVLVVTVGQLVCSVLAAYAFARLRFPGRDVLFWVYLGTLMVPQVVTLIPLYSMMSTAGLRDTFWGIVLPYVFGSPYAIFLLREYFRAIPADLVSAARLDGASTLGILRHVIVPLSRPILATLTIITVVTHWNNFLWPLIVTSSDQWRVVTVATSLLQTQYNGNWTLVMAASTLAMLPLIIVFVLFQRHVVRSITLSGIK